MLDGTVMDANRIFPGPQRVALPLQRLLYCRVGRVVCQAGFKQLQFVQLLRGKGKPAFQLGIQLALGIQRSEEHTSELQSLMRISYAVFCLKKKTHPNRQTYYKQSINNYTNYYTT